MDVGIPQPPRRRFRARSGDADISAGSVSTRAADAVERDRLDAAAPEIDNTAADNADLDQSTTDEPPLWWPLRDYPGKHTADRWTQNFISAFILALLSGYVLWAVHPEWIFQNTTPTGGDMGAHVWGPAYLRDHLLPNFRLSGWTPDWYNGFPVYTFYMVIPSLVIVILSVGFLPWWTLPLVAVGAIWLIARLRERVSNRVFRALATFGIAFGALLIVEIPYNVAFKLVAISGLVSLPAAVWWFGRGLGLRFGGPELMAVSSILFLMDKTLFSIFGGNVASTMAGEFCFSIALSLCFFFLGTMAKGIRTGEHRVAAAVLLSLAILSHAIVLFYAMAAALIVLALRPSARAFVWSAVTATVAGALAAFWYLPFYFNSQYLNDMGWEKSGPLRTNLGLSRTPDPFSINLDSSRTYWKFLLPFGPHSSLTGTGTGDVEPNMLHGKIIFALALIGALLALAFVVRAGIALTMMVIVSGIAFRFAPQGRFWNARILPIYYLCIFLLAAVGVFLLLRLLYGVVQRLLVGVGVHDESERSLLAAVFVPVLVPLMTIGLVWTFVTWTWPFFAQATALGVWPTLVKLVGPMLWGAVAVSIGFSVALFVPGPREVRALAGTLGAVVAGIVVWNLVAEADQWRATVAIWLGIGLVAGALTLRTTAPRTTVPSTITASITVALAMVVVFVALGMTFQNLPRGQLTVNNDQKQVFKWGPLTSQYVGVVRGWAEYNFRGLENKTDGASVSYTNEYFAVVNEMKRVGETNGCGRAMWEYDEKKQGSYGTPMAFMMFPYFTNGCIGSQEGLYFEASATTPYHFLMQDELSASCSCAQRFDIFGVKPTPYKGFNLDLGIRHMQMMGIRYYLAVSDVAKNAATLDPRLSKVGESGPYVAYAVADAPMVRGLDALPEVWPKIDDEPLDRVGPTSKWFLDPSRWDVIPATDGPANWPRNTAPVPPRHDSLDAEMLVKVQAALADPATFLNTGIDPATLDDVIEATDRERILDPLPAALPTQSVRQAQVSDIKQSDDTISFTVDQPGTPVLVTTSFFPNWEATGADGPWRVAPNMMVVVPTSNQVTLSYGRSGIELGSMLLTLIGIGLLLFLIRLGSKRFAVVGVEFWGERDEDTPVGPFHRSLESWRRREAARYPGHVDSDNASNAETASDTDSASDTMTHVGPQPLTIDESDVSPLVADEPHPTIIGRPNAGPDEPGDAGFVPPA